ncbi:crotonase/enoyl-CoA hydratase family protein [Neorhizobium galegae]|uniref:crotonase/enoyl-CoA hydratase family protein n=1 Tax=Neorhizobium galegae TaxID=399 RepID=UPI00062105C1|nr:crotonase/enoyl-CoA hydratase family protein [Neorhizobium galegae]MCQ1767300.1 crotonase/enoyl-CoA hydratase family protein [Neorhizobium galegae]MCQ1846756.1 crotonase/enoyl-CoA hydratase family protein [Neorhizobium galegae]CDZ42013.1 Methylglutaconyl-CoA hydratase [Neorhizobium galegae bv. officinalis]
MGAYDTLTLERDARGVVTLTLARPEKHNAMNARMIADLTDAAGRLAADDGVRVVVLASAGSTFCAGGDLQWMRDQAARDRVGKIEGATELALMLKALDDLPKPLIARVQGNAFGGGIGLLAVCDIVVAADSTWFALTETRLGLIPATIGPYVVRRIGEGHARRLFLNARRFDAVTAREIGLVSVVRTELDAAVEEEVSAFLDCAPGAVASAKSLVQNLARQTIEDPVGYSTGLLADRWESAEGRDGIDAFLNRRPMPWAAPKAGED